jgi:hypothetical protein
MTSSFRSAIRAVIPVALPLTLTAMTFGSANGLRARGLRLQQLCLPWWFGIGTVRSVVAVTARREPCDGGHHGRV